MQALAERQLALLGRMANLDPAPCFMGGFAEDALLAGALTRAHEDIDLVFPRSELSLRLAQVAELGFTTFERWGESAPGEPFYLFGQNGDLRLDLGVSDEAEGSPVVNVHKLMFEVDGKEAPAGYRLLLPDDMYARQGSFGPLSERQQSSMRQLRERFFPDRTEAELEPVVEPLG